MRIDRRLRKRLVQRGIQRAARRQIAPERFFDDQPGAAGAAGLRETRRDGTEQARRDRQIEQRRARSPSAWRSAANVAGS